jgi:hypothetical protein
MKRGHVRWLRRHGRKQLAWVDGSIARRNASQRSGGILIKGGSTTLPAWLTGNRAGGSIDLEPDDRSRVITGVEDAAAAYAARGALCTFLEGFGIGADERPELVEQLLSGARACRCDEPHESLSECAILHAEQQFEAWLGFVLGAESLAGQPALPVGRAAFLACGGPAKWGHLILVDEPLPEAFVAAMRVAAPTLAPLPMPGPMAAQSLETWSIADAGHAAAEVVDAQLAWLGYARPLIAVPIRLTKPTA